MDAEVEHAALEEPSVGDGPPMLFPEPRPPERLAAGVLEAPPREVSDVLCPRRPAQRPCVLDELLHAAQVFRAGVVARYGGHVPAR